jgi:hypothetical protein
VVAGTVGVSGNPPKVGNAGGATDGAGKGAANPDALPEVRPYGFAPEGELAEFAAPVEAEFPPSRNNRPKKLESSPHAGRTPAINNRTPDPSAKRQYRCDLRPCISDLLAGLHSS